MDSGWYILDTGIKSAAENIALDSILLDAKANSKIPNILRFLQFSPPAVLIGYHQTVGHEVRVEFCNQHRIDINRRITGGGAIYFDTSQLGWEIIATKTHLGYRLDKITERICKAVVIGLKKLGLNAKFRPRNDIEVNGRKISGTGGIFEGNAVLFQGTLLVDFDVDTMLRALRIPTEKLVDKELDSIRQRVTCLKEELSNVPPISKIKQALQEGFEKVLGIKFIDCGLQIADYGLDKIFHQKKNKFASKSWIESTREPIKNSQTLIGTHRARSGLIRVLAVVDVKRKILKQVLITGDFFISPARTIFDLEANLKDVPCNEVSKRIEEFFKNKHVQMQNLTWTDFADAFSAALEKIEYSKLGISLEEANYLFTVNGTPYDILKSPTVLLLPYCAKLIDCEYRYNGGCDKCGKCSVGKAYELAEKYKLTPITIQNFDHLKATLNKYKKNGIKSYIGCCCEAFFTKHQDMFKKARIPAVLIDIENSTCYDLDKELDGLAGKFENQTNLRLELLKKVISHANNL
jgi:lipoate-protein ligase A